jgi:hypothetical protein
MMTHEYFDDKPQSHICDRRSQRATDANFISVVDRGGPQSGALYCPIPRVRCNRLITVKISKLRIEARMQLRFLC